MNFKDKKLNFLIVDDHSLIREGIKASLQKGYSNIQIEEAGDGRTALNLFHEYEFDYIFLDISLPDANGMDLAEEMLSIRRDVTIVIISMYNDQEFVTKCIELGVKGYIHKTEGTEINSAIEAIADGDVYYSRSIQNLIVKGFTKNIILNVRKKKIQSITKREKEVIRLIIKGKTSVEIAEDLFISVRTVDTHRSNLMKKLDVKNSIELINKVHDLHLLED